MSKKSEAKPNVVILDSFELDISQAWDMIDAGVKAAGYIPARINQIRVISPYPRSKMTIWAQNELTVEGARVSIYRKEDFKGNAVDRNNAAIRGIGEEPKIVQVLLQLGEVIPHYQRDGKWMTSTTESCLEFWSRQEKRPTIVQVTDGKDKWNTNVDPKRWKIWKRERTQLEPSPKSTGDSESFRERSKARWARS